MIDRSFPVTGHITDEDLLLLVDGEVSLRKADRVRTHIANCPECRARLAEIESCIAEVASVHRQTSERGMDAAGPRAMLQVRLAQIAQETPNRGWGHLRLARSLAYACALTLLIAGAVTFWNSRAAARAGTYARLLPDPSYTPGSTRETTLAELCASDGDEVVRSVPRSLQQKVFEEYGIKGMPAEDFEVDYLITPGLGGSDDVRNLWPEPHSSAVWNSYVKDQLEDHLHHMVCARQLSLDEAQKDIAANWIAAYKKYFHTEQPLSRATMVNLRESAAVATPSGIF